MYYWASFLWLRTSKPHRRQRSPRGFEVRAPSKMSCISGRVQRRTFCLENSRRSYEIDHFCKRAITFIDAMRVKLMLKTTIVCVEEIRVAFFLTTIVA
jgi:hypothetical protein